MPKKIYLLLIVLIPAALLFSFAALVGRADSLEEASRGKVSDWIILGPLWAAIVFLAATAIARSHPKSLHIGVGAAVIVWVTVALTSNWWEDKKIQMRMEHRKHYQIQHDGAVTNTMSNNSLQPMPVGRLSSAFAVDIFHPAWLSSGR